MSCLRRHQPKAPEFSPLPPTIREAQSQNGMDGQGCRLVARLTCICVWGFTPPDQSDMVRVTCVDRQLPLREIGSSWATCPPCRQHVSLLVLMLSGVGTNVRLRVRQQEAEVNISVIIPLCVVCKALRPWCDAYWAAFAVADLPAHCSHSV